eukprot:470943-Pelagomonas_calceolata.AAC.8
METTVAPFSQLSMRSVRSGWQCVWDEQPGGRLQNWCAFQYIPVLTSRAQADGCSTQAVMGVG